jgi:methionine salvage enolase-phosphatase E1
VVVIDDDPRKLDTAATIGLETRLVDRTGSNRGAAHPRTHDLGLLLGELASAYEK